METALFALANASLSATSYLIKFTLPAGREKVMSENSNNSYNANDKNRSTASDIPTRGWVYSLPKFTQPYARLARLDRPIGTWLLLLPCLWGLALASATHPDHTYPSLFFIILFAIGALVMRGAGCTWNDISDQDFDRQVARTADRPIPAGDVSTKQALAFLVIQCLIGLAILWQFNDVTRIVGASALFLVIGYPFMKRITYWPQAWLGLTFNWGILVSWAAIYGDISNAALILYAAGICWTLGYDTIYAHQDKEDDMLIGVKSTALRFGKNSITWITLFYLGTIGLIGTAACFAHVTTAFWPFWLLGAMQLIWQLYKLDIDNPDICLKLFKSNRDFGLLIFIGFIAGGYELLP